MSLESELYARLKLLNEKLWENRATRPDIDRWLDNFSDPDTRESDRLQGLYLLSQFVYFGDRELRELLRALYRDKFRYPLTRALVRDLGIRSSAAIETAFQSELARTRFLAVGNPAESGTHLLYLFRQENSLRKRLFIHAHDVFDKPMGDPTARFASPHIERLVFIDDFCGTGSQAKRYSSKVLRAVRDVSQRTSSRMTVSYLCLVATHFGLDVVRRETLFDEAESVYVLDDSYRCFSSGSRHFKVVPPGVSSETAAEMAARYGTRLRPADPLGYGNSQLLVGFHHNIPDNTLPIIWYAEPDHPEWKAIFRRFEKIYD